MGQAAARLPEIVDRARAAHESVVITENGAAVAAVIAIEDLEELQRAQDERDIAVREQAMQRRGEALTHDEFMAALAREDAASA